MKKAVFRSIMALALVLGLTLTMAVPVVAQEEGVDGGKTTVWEAADGHPWRVYLVGQTIFYELYLTNYEEPSATVTFVRDTFGYQSPGEYSLWWDGDAEEWVLADSDPEEPWSLDGESSWTEPVHHVIGENHLVEHPTIPGARALRNRITAFATQNADEYNIGQTYTVQVIEPAIHLSKSADPEEASVGHVVEYTFIITNTGDWPLENIVLVDPLVGVDYLVPEVLGPGEDYELGPVPYTIQEGDLPLTNTATVWGVAQGFDPNVFPYSEDPGPEDPPSAVVTYTASDTVTALHPVGGTASPVSKLALLAPWIVLAGLIAGAAVFVWSRRAQSRA